MPVAKRSKIGKQACKSAIAITGYFGNGCLVFSLLLLQSAFAQPPAQPISSNGADAFETKLEAARANFISQGPTKFNPNGSLRNKDCGPTSMVMALKLLGKMPSGSDPENAEKLIERLRFEMTGQENHRQGLSPEQEMEEARKFGLSCRIVTGLNQIDEALDNGELVLGGGNPGWVQNGVSTWMSRFSESDYPQNANGLHRILIVARGDQGYIINDPLSRVGPLIVTAKELEAFIAAPRAKLHGGYAVKSATDGVVLKSVEVKSGEMK